MDKIEMIYEEQTEIGHFCLYNENKMFFIKFRHKENLIPVNQHELYGPYDENKVLRFLFKEFVDKVNLRTKIAEKCYEMFEYADKMICAQLPDPDNQ